MFRLPRVRKEDRRGAAMVEMAVVLPVFMMVVLGVIEFGRAMMVGQLVTNAAREGARLAVLDGSSNTEVEQAIEDFLTSSVNVSSGSITITITVTPASGNPDPGNEVAYANSRDLINIQVSIPFNDASYLPGDYLAGSNLVGECAMRHE